MTPKFSNQTNINERVSLPTSRQRETVFTQFYLKENPKELADKTIYLVGDLENNLLSVNLEKALLIC